MEPEKVNHSKFKVQHILYNNTEFSIAYGQYEGGQFCLAMRWNGSGNDPGYPKLFNNPVWFLVDNKLKLPIIKSLLELDSSDNEALIKALENELKTS
ncbi:MAG: hypothetical protein MUF43_13650 [Flavobacterium sp.]|jgi:hypothetical protein|nr:hypothetical protein [Flavobacterium sp.]